MSTRSGYRSRPAGRRNCRWDGDFTASELGLEFGRKARTFAMLGKKDETIVEIGKGLRREAEEVTREPLPQRWVALIHRLTEKERKQADARNQRGS